MAAASLKPELQHEHKHVVHDDTFAAIGLLPKLPFAMLISIGLVIGSLVPQRTAHGIAALFAISSMYGLVSRARKGQKLVRPGRWTQRFHGDFVVFLIGARNNSLNPLNLTFKEMGDAMQAMQKELEDKPELGCLGSENYVGARSYGSDTIMVSYWKSAEHLKRFAQNPAHSHLLPWIALAKHAKDHVDVGFWHETFEVKQGGMESIAVNMPPFAIGVSREAIVEPAKGRMKTMDGRLGKGEGDAAKEWPKEEALNE